ncbi:MAG: Extracellular serine proteinase [Gemmatimonadaceae bacterium]|nr:Extracellular serine proteinase [Gemmatimonadaceae bacterium]
MLRKVLGITALGALVAACADSTGSTGEPLARLVSNSASVNAELVPNEYVVVLKSDGGSVASEAAKVRRLGGVVLSEWTEGLIGLAIRIPASKLDAVRRNPNVAYVEQSQMYHTNAQKPCLNPGALFGCSWGWDRVSDRTLPLNNLKAFYPNAGTGVKIYVIDTGINPTHTEFTGRAYYLYDEVGNDPVAADCHGHGTSVASMAAGINYGFAEDATIYASRVLDCSGNGTTTDVIDGINRVTTDHLAGQGAVANMSLGGGYSAAMNAAVAASVADGVVYAVAAGNSDDDACFYSPASEPSANTIGATGNDPGFATPPAAPDEEAYYSNHGTCLDGYAPGTNILGAWYTSNTAAVIISGTSMAAPHFAGVAAVYLGNFPGKTPTQVRNAIWNYATNGVVQLIGPGSPNKLLHNSRPSVNFDP